MQKSAKSPAIHWVVERQYPSVWIQITPPRLLIEKQKQGVWH